MFATITGINETTVRFQKMYVYGRASMSLLLWLSIYTFACANGHIDFNHITTYLFGFALASLFASIMIYAARVLHEQTPDVQEPKAITYIADISYGIYLFHWPFYIIFSQLMSHILAVILTVFLFNLVCHCVLLYCGTFGPREKTKPAWFRN